MVTAGRAQNTAPDWREGVAKPFRAVILSASLREGITSISVAEGTRHQPTVRQSSAVALLHKIKIRHAGGLPFF
ncbi:MAG: hypothetical protein V4555_10610, partial [Acidobacteriota bacterium]